MDGFSSVEKKALQKLSTPNKIQDYLDSIPFNFEKKGDTLMSPRRVLREKRAHCIEGALLAAAALQYHGRKALLLDLKVASPDLDHVVALYKENGYWGAISKTNHAVLRFRDPVYKTVRELALSYFHEYFLPDTGRKTLRSYSRPFPLIRYGKEWMTAEEDLWSIGAALDDTRHYPTVPKKNKALLRKASVHERKAMQFAEWKENGRR
jgi:hypothetical protein